MLEELEVWEVWEDWEDWEEVEETTAGLRWDRRLPSSDCSDRYGAVRGGRKGKKWRLGTDGDVAPLGLGPSGGGYLSRSGTLERRV